MPDVTDEQEQEAAELAAEIERDDYPLGPARHRDEFPPEIRELQEQTRRELDRRPGRPSLHGGGKPSPSLTIRLDPERRTRLGKLAEQTGRTESEIVREALDQYVERS